MPSWRNQIQRIPRAKVDMGMPSTARVSPDFPGNVGSVARSMVDRINFHKPSALGQDSPKRINGPPGTAFNKPVEKGFFGDLYRRFQNAFQQADTRPDRKSFRDADGAVPPNPGRPQFGRQ